MTIEEKVFLWFVGIIAFIILIAFLLSLVGIESTCNIKEKFNDDLYCIKHYRNNLSNSFDGWVERSHEADRIYLLEQEEKRKIQAEKDKEIQKCYDEGYLVNETFTIKDYGLSCRKVDYLNDHLMDSFEKKDGGYVSSSYRGFFSSRSTKTQIYQYINDRVMATGQLIENINYHIDCKGIKHNENIDYFTEEEFVMYYVERCI